MKKQERKKVVHELKMAMVGMALNPTNKAYAVYRGQYEALLKVCKLCGVTQQEVDKALEESQTMAKAVRRMYEVHGIESTGTEG